jgi:MFS family permease
LPSRLVASALFYAVGFSFILVFHSDYYQFVIGMIITTFGEMLIAPTIPTFITETTGSFAPFYLGVVGAFSSMGKLIGPYIFGNMFDLWGAYPIFALTTIISSVAALSFIVHASLNSRRLHKIVTTA